MNGEPAWKIELGGNFEKGSLIKVGAYLSNQDVNTGEVALIEPSSNANKELARAGLFDSEKPQPGLQWISIVKNYWCAIWRK